MCDAHNHDNENDHDSSTRYRAYLLGFRTFVEHLTLWGQLSCMVGCPPLACLVIGLGIGCVFGREDHNAHRLVDAANESTKTEDIERLKNENGYTEEKILETEIPTRDLISIQFHVHDEGTINWCFWASAMYTIITAAIPGLTIAAWATSLVGSSVAFFNTATYSTIENLTFKMVGAILGYVSTKADERTCISQAQRFTFWQDHHHELVNKEQKHDSTESNSTTAQPTIKNSLTHRAGEYLKSCCFYGRDQTSTIQAPDSCMANYERVKTIAMV